MTDRYHALTVVLDREIRNDDAKRIIEAIEMVRGVLSVEPHVADHISRAAERKAVEALRDKLRDVLWPGIGK
jgi:hypothetical protein